MPRAATAIIAIACSASYLGADTGVVPGHGLRCVGKSKRSRALSRRSLERQNLVLHFGSRQWDSDDEDDDEGSDLQDDVIPARLAIWSQASTDFDTLSKVCGDVDVATLASVGCKALARGTAPALSTLPEELILNMLEYVGIEGRTACRASKRWCDPSLKDGMVLPTFPVNLSVKQHYHFGPQEPITTTWTLDVKTPSTPASLQVCTDSESEDNGGTRESPKSGMQVLRLCHELRSLQTELGARYREDGRTQVEVVATDATGRTLLDHSYEHQIFCSKADDLLELLTESEPHVPSTTSLPDCQNGSGDAPQCHVIARTGSQCAASARPVSRPSM